jgi:hypothetical protein
MKTADKKRIIVDYKTLPEHILEELSRRYPDGEYDDDVIKFNNARKEVIKALRVEDDQCVYLVKISVQLQQAVEDFDDVEELENNEELEENED